MQDTNTWIPGYIEEGKRTSFHLDVERMPPLGELEKAIQNLTLTNITHLSCFINEVLGLVIHTENTVKLYDGQELIGIKTPPEGTPDSWITAQMFAMRSGEYIGLAYNTPLETLSYHYDIPIEIFHGIIQALYKNLISFAWDISEDLACGDYDDNPGDLEEGDETRKKKREARFQVYEDLQSCIEGFTSLQSWLKKTRDDLLKDC